MGKTVIAWLGGFRLFYPHHLMFYYLCTICHADERDSDVICSINR